jgi:hypothetical protein
LLLPGQSTRAAYDLNLKDDAAVYDRPPLSSRGRDAAATTTTAATTAATKIAAARAIKTTTR